MIRSMFFWKYFKNDAAITYIYLIYKESTEQIVCLTARAVGLLRFYPVKYIGIYENLFPFLLRQVNSNVRLTGKFVLFS